MTAARRGLAAGAAIASALIVPLFASARPDRAPMADPVTVQHSSVAACATSSLVIWLDTNGDGAAGSIYFKLKLTNASTRRCTVTGYPGVSAVDLTGHRLGRAASRISSHVATVTLTAGATATATLRIAQAANFPATSCRPALAAGLRVYPPNQTTAKVVPFPFRACTRLTPVFLSIGAVA